MIIICGIIALTITIITNVASPIINLPFERIFIPTIYNDFGMVYGIGFTTCKYIPFDFIKYSYFFINSPLSQMIYFMIYDNLWLIYYIYTIYNDFTITIVYTINDHINSDNTIS